MKGNQHVVEIKDHFSTSDRHYLVMELCSGGTLSSYLKKPELNIDIFFNVIKSLLAFLSDMKKARLVHRDLKPRNILFTRDMKVKIIDFGLAATY